MLFPGKDEYTGRHAGEYVPRKRRTGCLIWILAALLLAALIIWPLAEPYMIETEYRTLYTTDLPEGVRQLRIVYLTDVHAGRYFNEARVADLVRRVNAMDADLVLLGGDFAEDSDAAAGFFLNAPAFRSRYGVFAVPGNHDRTPPESNLSRLKAAMQYAGVTPLVNSVSHVRIGGSTIVIAGIDDANCGHPDIQGVAAQTHADDYVIFLSHTPAVIPDALAARDASQEYGWFDLGLFGHTHGGQVALFGSMLHKTDVDEAYLSGWLRRNRTDLLISRGVGVSVLPIRFLCRPQIHVITVQPYPQ